MCVDTFYDVRLFYVEIQCEVTAGKGMDSWMANEVAVLIYQYFYDTLQFAYFGPILYLRPRLFFLLPI